jgi:hypothetical protein
VNGPLPGSIGAAGVCATPIVRYQPEADGPSGAEPLPICAVEYRT